MASRPGKTFRKFRAGIGTRGIRGGGSVAGQIRAEQTRKQIRKLTGRLNLMLVNLRKTTPEALEFALWPIYKTSQELCPVSAFGTDGAEPGRLKESGYLETQMIGKQAFAEIGYAKDSMPDYAVYAHEMPYKHEPPTQSKFLEEAINRHIAEVLPRVKRALKAGMGR